VLDYSGVTTGPTLLLQWPENGVVVGGSSVTVRGYVDDPTATIKATMTLNGEVQEFQGIVERDGLFWIENLPLNVGNNAIILNLMNAAGLTTIQNLSVTRSSVELTMNPLDDEGLKQVFTNFSGTFSDLNYSVWVNGRKATVNSDNTWNASSVYLNDGGTATFHVTAIPNSDNNGDGTPPAPGTPLNNVQSPNPTSPNSVRQLFDIEKPAFIRIKKYKGNSGTWSSSWNPCTEIHSDPFSDTWTCAWVNGAGGIMVLTYWRMWCNDEDEVESGSSAIQVNWDPEGHASASGAVGTYVPPPPPERPWEHCDIYLQWELGPWEGLPPEIYQHKRKAQSTVELHTGGKSVSHQKNLFTLSVTATGFRELCGLGPQEPCFPEYDIEPTRIFIPGLGRSVGSDYLLYAQLADNQNIDVTPRVLRCFRWNRFG